MTLPPYVYACMYLCMYVRSNIVFRTSAIKKTMVSNREIMIVALFDFAVLVLALLDLPLLVDANGETLARAGHFVKMR